MLWLAVLFYAELSKCKGSNWREWLLSKYDQRLLGVDAAWTRGKLAGYTVPLWKTIQPTTSTRDLPTDDSLRPSHSTSIVTILHLWCFGSKAFTMKMRRLWRRRKARIRMRGGEWWGDPSDQSPNKRICESGSHKFGSTGLGQRADKL